MSEVDDDYESPDYEPPKKISGEYNRFYNDNEEEIGVMQNEKKITTQRFGKQSNQEMTIIF